MDIKKLCNLDGKSVTVNVEDTSIERGAAKRFLSKGRKRIEDSAMPARSEERKRWASRMIKDVLSNADLSVEDMNYIADSVESILNKFEDRYSRINDSYGKSKSEISEMKKKIADSAEQLKAYKELGTIEQLKKKISDAEFVIEDKEKRDAEAEQREKQLEDQEKQLEEEKKRLEEEKKCLEEQKAAQTVTVQDSVVKKVYKLKFNKVKDNINTQIQDDLTVKKDLLSRFAATFEDWIQTGSAYLEEKLKQTTEAIGDENLKTLVDKATNYEPLDSNTYEDLTSDLKKALNDNGLKIPSLALIQDSAILEALEAKTNPSKEVPLSLLVTAIQNFTIQPNPETRTKAKDLAEQLKESPLKEKINELLSSTFDGCTSERAIDLAKEIEAVAKKGGEKIKVQLRKFDEVPLKFPNAENLIENKPVEPVMTHVQYQSVFDTAERFNTVLKFVHKVYDCSDCCEAVGPGCPPIPEIQAISPVEGTNYIAVVIQGVSKLYVVNEGVNPLELMTKFNNTYGQERWEVVNTCLTPLEPILKVAQDLGQYDLVTDSALYKRHASDKFWVTDTVLVADSADLIDKFIRLTDSLEQIEQIKNATEGFKKVRIAVADSKEVIDCDKDMKSIYPKKIVDFKGKTNIRLYLA